MGKMKPPKRKLDQSTCDHPRKRIVGIGKGNAPIWHCPNCGGKYGKVLPKEER